VPAAWLAAILWGEIDRRGPRPAQDRRRNPGLERSGWAILLDELEAAGLNRTSSGRRLYDVLHGRQRLVTVTIADEVLQALELPHVWHDDNAL
jgi:hypothetical protein